MTIEEIDVRILGKRLGFIEKLKYPDLSRQKPLEEWKMEVDDAPIFRYIYRNLRPRRHLEFGTWEGTGVLYCLEECDATVWTINLPDGEFAPDRKWAYAREFGSDEIRPEWCRSEVSHDQQGREVRHFQTDSFGFIGRLYREEGLGSRVCQVYSDSQSWDISNYPEEFFDTILIDGGHSREVVVNDTEKAMVLLRKGGLLLWHDYCPASRLDPVGRSTKGVVEAIESLHKTLQSELDDLFWIDPSWILVGKKKSAWWWNAGMNALRSRNRS